MRGGRWAWTRDPREGQTSSREEEREGKGFFSDPRIRNRSLRRFVGILAIRLSDSSRGRSNEIVGSLSCRLPCLKYRARELAISRNVRGIIAFTITPHYVHGH